MAHGRIMHVVSSCYDYVYVSLLFGLVNVGLILCILLLFLAGQLVNFASGIN